jgi:chromosome segregation ATPase
MEPQPPKPTTAAPSAQERSNPASAATAAKGSIEASARRTGASQSLPVPVATPEPKQPLWRRIGILAGGRRSVASVVETQLDTVRTRLDMLRTRLDVIEEQLRGIGGALARGSERVSDHVDETAERTGRELQSQIDHLGARLDEQADGIGAALRADLALLDSRVGQLGADLFRSQKDAAAGIREPLEQIEGRFTELWEVGEQLAQISELSERLVDAREQTNELGARVRTLLYAVYALCGLVLAMAGGLGALYFLK